MIDVEVSEGEIRAVDVEKNEVTIQVDGWGPTATAPRLDRRVDKAISGETVGIELPLSAITVESVADESWTAVNDDLGEYTLPPIGHVIQVSANVEIYIATTDGCRILRPRFDGPIRLEFDESSAVSLGFRSKVSRPRHTITVPRSIEGATSALRYLSSAIHVDNPNKSYPSLRAHPPRIEFGDGIDIPESVYREVSFSDVHVSIPRSVESLLLAAPLVYYLKADVLLYNDASVEIDSPALDQPLTLGKSSLLENDIAELLHRVFYMDCLVRNAGPYGEEIRELSLIDKLDSDIRTLYDESTGERLQTYLDINYTQAREHLPEWHLSMVLQPTLDHVRALPHALDRMSLIQMPKPVTVAAETLVSEAIDASSQWVIRRRGSSRKRELVRNEHRLGRMMGWIADGIPVDAFCTTIDAFEHRFNYHEHNSGPRSVLVIFNDESMVEERSAIEQIYRDRSEELAMDILVEELLNREQLADRLNERIDFLHYVGHCDEGGFRCSDGSLSATELDDTNVQTFFLNACSSFDEGMALVERGSVGGVVTLDNVLNPQATKVGTIFARLVMHGYDISLALELSRKFAIENKLYAVVGDGSHRLMQGDSNSPGINKISSETDIGERLSFETQSLVLSLPGAIIQTMKNVVVPLNLMGNTAKYDISVQELITTWENTEEPVFFEGEYHWSSDLMEVFTEEFDLGTSLSAQPDYNHASINNN